MEPTKIKCENCALASECVRKQVKQKYDDAGWRTYCPSGIKVWQGPKRRNRR